MGKGKTVRSIQHFISGLWSPDMDTRADLQASVNACRKLDNFILDPYGNAERRLGLQHIGGALGECSIIDPDTAADPSGLVTSTEEIDPVVDQYGSLGPATIGLISAPADWWLLCDWLVHCFGPENEGDDITGYLTRYTVRWHAKLEDGWIYYGKVGEPWILAPSALYPTQLPNATGLGFCFDVSGEPVFATQIGSNVEIRRLAAGIPQTYTFIGNSPKLFLNSQVQWHDTLWDVVCYYATTGQLRARFQRDNFGTGYILYDEATRYVTKVKYVESPLLDSRRVYIAVQGNLTGGGTLRGLMKTNEHPLTPLTDTAYSSLSFLGDGSYEEVSVETTAEDSAQVAFEFSSDADYSSGTVASVASDSGTVQMQFSADGDYALVVVSGGSYAETAYSTLEWYNDGDYVLGTIYGGSYSETATSTLTFNSDGDYSP